MFLPPRATNTPRLFRPAVEYLLSTDLAPRFRRDDSATMSATSRTNLQANNIPLISISRSPSPFHRRRSGSNPTSEEEDDDFQFQSTRQPFLDQGMIKSGSFKDLFYNGGLGYFLFQTHKGWRVYVGFLILWLGGCGIGLICMNRIILLTGVYKFPYPLTTTLLEMLITHGLLLLSATLTRLLSPWLVAAGLTGAIAPSQPLQSSSSPRQLRSNGLMSKLSRWSSTGGIAGGGLFEFDLAVMRQVLPLCIIFVAKVILSNLSFAYAQLPMYTLARVAIVPLSLFFTTYLNQMSHSVSTLSSTLTATLALLVATSRSNIRVTWESIVAGAFSSIFVALYPVQLHRTYKSLVSSLVPQGDVLSYSNAPTDASGSREEARATWRLLHYTSLVSILIFLPIVALSGEIGNIARNCYFLDVFFHWLMIACGGIGSWAVFLGTVVLTKTTSPLTTTFLFIPRAAFLLPILVKTPVYSWVGLAMCWASCVWYMHGQRKEGRSQRLP
ncbi:hypothetical protein F5884DRAFT_667214 [Xylogone sp. PMI_703]|nr:hypothetical protein F5884DRAFT_667214 [Xylogone sp. PMI_703]